MNYKDYKGLFKGESLFVCGNAPSLAQYYPELENYYTFTCNHINLWKERPFASTFYGVTEPMHYGRWELKQESSKGSEHKFALSINRPEPWQSDWTWLPKFSGAGISQEGLSLNAPFRTGANTPLNIGIQFGVYMGFANIYLIGIELSDFNEHVYPKPGNDRIGKSKYDLRHLIPGYNIGHYDAALAGTHVWNCTKHGAIYDKSTIRYIEFKDARERSAKRRGEERHASLSAGMV